MIPLSRPSLGDEEIQAIKDVILSGWITQGIKVSEFERAFANYTGAEFACAVSSCTAALHLSLLAAGVKPGDVVITVSHSFIATSNAIRHCGAEPVFVDIDPETYNMSAQYLNDFINKNCEIRDGQLYYKQIAEIACGESPLASIIKFNRNIGKVTAILPVHQVGMPCDINNIISIARQHNIPVIEDAACAIGSEIIANNNEFERIGKPHGDIACFSFHPRKILTTGEGGMITTNNPEFYKKIMLLRQQCMSISDVARHNSKEILLESYLSTGYNYKMTDIQAAIGIEQLKKLPEIISIRRKVDSLYRKYLGNISWLKLPKQPEYAKANWQSYAIRILDNSPLSRNELMQYLLDNEISTRPGIMNAHQEQPYSGFNHNLPESEKARNSVILFPIYHQLGEKQIEKIRATLELL